MFYPQELHVAISSRDMVGLRHLVADTLPAMQLKQHEGGAGAGGQAAPLLSYERLLELALLCRQGE
jgi:hypothetical protein